MHKNKVLLVITLTIISVLTAISQNNTNSPYTRFGYGQISDNTSGEQRAMGGVGIGARSNHRINTVNPASYSVSDSLTFMFDFGVSGLLSRFSDDYSDQTKFNANLDYLTLQFRVFKHLGISAGLLPYSYAGYNFYSVDSISMPEHPGDTTTIRSTTSYLGTGGFSQFYVGLSADLFNHFSIGVNFYYMFGSYDNSRSMVFSSSNYADVTNTYSISANNVRFRFGAQYYNTFAEKHDLTIGAIYEPKMKLNGKAEESITVHSTIETNDISDAFELPQMFGGGIYYTYNHKFSIGVDYSMNQWKDALYFGRTDSLVNSSKLAIGVEYQPNYRGRKFGDRIMYRAGFNMSNPYYKVNGEDPGKNFGITFGVGFPLQSSSRTMLNMSLEYGKMGSSSLLREDYFKFTFNFSLAETWFFKRKL